MVHGDVRTLSPLLFYSLLSSDALLFDDSVAECISCKTLCSCSKF